MSVTPANLHTDSPVVQLVGVTKTFVGPNPVSALINCNLTVDRGDYVAVQGPSGSGKSTFLNIVGLLDTPTAGKYFLAGLDSQALNDGELTSLRAHSIGFVFQAFHLVSYRNVLENVELGALYQRRPRRRSDARRALSEVSLAHRVLASPTTLSGGERQRVAIARALYSEPTLLLCDEPTGNLDSNSTESFLDVLDILNSRGMTIVVVTHDPSVASRASRHVLIVDGSLSEA